MDEKKFNQILWIGDSIGDALGMDVETSMLNAESLFEQKGILVVKVGNDERPASVEDLEDVVNSLKLAFENWPKKPIVIVTHHAMDFSIIEIEKLIKKTKVEE